MAWDIPRPSLGEVPRPSSSININEFAEDRPGWATMNRSNNHIFLGLPRIIAEDDISSANVLRFLSMSSSLDNLVSNAS